MKVTRVNLSELSLDPANVRKHTEKNLAAIKASLRRFGQQKPIVVDADGVVRAGNGTLEAARELGWTDISVVRTELRGSEATAYAIADNRTAELATWDTAALVQQLEALKIEDPDLVPSAGFSTDDISLLESQEPQPASVESEEGKAGIDGFYTSKIESLVYEMTGERPEIAQMVDTSTRDKLIANVTNAEIDEDVKNFLIAAAYRHVVFNYSNIAEYYAHASPDVQRLMEESALVIVDFGRAKELGFIKMNQLLGELVDVERSGTTEVDGGDLT